MLDRWLFCLESLEKHGGIELVWIDLDTFNLALPTYYTIACAEASSNLSRYDGIRYGSRSASSATQLPQAASDGNSGGERERSAGEVSDEAASSSLLHAMITKSRSSGTSALPWANCVFESWGGS